MSDSVKEMVQRIIDIQGGIKIGDEAAKFPPIDSPPSVRYFCPICEQDYDTFAEAEACRDQPFETYGMQVGDLVLIPGERRYHSIEDDDPWVAFKEPPDPKSPSHFDHNWTWHVWYVVTAIHNTDKWRRHRLLVTVCSLAGGRLDYGWNPLNGDGHYAMFKYGEIDSGYFVGKRSTFPEDSKLMELMRSAVPSETVIEQAKELAEMKISSSVLL